MYFKQFVAEGLGCLSYLIGCPMARVACVVDPRRDMQVYLDVARENDMRITHVFETHVHADHVSGNQEIKSRTGAEICYMEDTPVKFEHTVLTEGQEMTFGNAKLKFIKTPGHTPHAMSILVTDLSRGEDPWLVLTGDCMFVGDVGRPDLAGNEHIDEQVQNLYNSLYNKLGMMPDSLEVFPAHGEGSLCGRGMSSKSSSTIGFEKRSNELLRMAEPDFKKEMSGTFPERPKSFSHIINTNMEGVPLLDRCPVVKDLSPAQVEHFMQQGALVLDARDTASFGGVHIPGSINIGLKKQTANWIGMVIDPKADLILVVPDEKAYHDMEIQLHRIGYDRIIGYLYGGITAWQEEGLPITQLWQISPEKLKNKLAKGQPKYFFDVRTPAEWASGHIQYADHLPITQLLKSPPDIPKDEEVIVTCAVGYRGNIAASFLQSQGFEHVHSLAGGMKAWINSGYPVT
ncbi:beta-lactamase domain protein [Desulfatibacillum aliphaticivorans]|uniref:Beta-lactamase domain protein n=1 Tax=Desulfatibacillum aliphaticivorans TaxID=218208 RepID=B8FAV3_DESAL|nr:MBL fold metallo-hydrolase [Desulfatibacillum aliphaticivorans]ACL04039.1 beta-lactamase domain protein [Desulfatibacillum aliphaticivorans]